MTKVLNKLIKWRLLVIAMILVLLLGNNFEVRKNTRYLEKILSEDITSGIDTANGNAKDLFTLDYDKVYRFEPYQSKEEMEKQIGFKYWRLKEGLSEGIINILFVKNNKPIAYLFGYSTNIGYYLSIQEGEYTKAQIDKMTYIMEEIEVGNSAGTPKRYMCYEFYD